MNDDLANEARFRRLRVWNVVVGLILAVQALAIALLTNGFSLPVTATFMTGPPGTTVEFDTLFDIPLGWGVFASSPSRRWRCSRLPRPASSSGTSAT